jgi:hypothetical protein
MSADIVRLVPRPDRGREPTDFPAIAFRSACEPDDLRMDHDDTAPCEYLRPENDASA